MDGGKRIERWGAFVFSGPFGLRESISTVHGVPENTDVVFWGHGVDGNGDAVCTCFGERRLAGLHTYHQRWNWVTFCAPATQ